MTAGTGGGNDEQRINPTPYGTIRPGVLCACGGALLGKPVERVGPSAGADDMKRVASLAPFVHTYMSEYPAGPVKSHETGDDQLNVQLVLSSNPRDGEMHNFWQSWQSFGATPLILLSFPFIPRACRPPDGVKQVMLHSSV